MADRRFTSQSLTADELHIAVAEIPEPERSVVEMDLPRIQQWLREHPDIDASVTIDRAAFDAGQGHVLLVVAVKGDHAAVRRELEPLVVHPDRLRVRAYRPPSGDLYRALHWVMDTRMTPLPGSRTFVTTAGVDERGGVVVVTLNQRDPQYAEELVARTDGLVRVESEPTVVEFVGPGRYSPSDQS